MCVSGNVTSAHLYDMLPFGDDIVALTVSGETLKSVFEKSISAYENNDSNGHFLQMSGKISQANVFVLNKFSNLHMSTFKMSI